MSQSKSSDSEHPGNATVEKLNIDGHEPQKGILDFFWRKRDSLHETLIGYQIENESDLFKHLNLMRVMNYAGQSETMEERERVYFRFYAKTFRMEVFSTFLTFPVGYFGYQFYLEHSKPIKFIPSYNKSLLKLLAIGLPSLNYYLVALYRRYFYKHPYEGELKLKYMEELRKYTKKGKN